MRNDARIVERVSCGSVGRMHRGWSEMFARTSFDVPALIFRSTISVCNHPKNYGNRTENWGCIYRFPMEQKLMALGRERLQQGS